MGKIKKDEFSNRAMQRLTLSAVNTLTYEQISFAVGVFQGVALVLHRVRYWLRWSVMQELVATTDSVQFGLSVSKQLADINPVHVELIDQHEIIPIVIGTATNVIHTYLPVVADFTALPGGGKIIPANPLYLVAMSGGCTNVLIVDVDIDFTFKELVDADYLELIQSRIQSNL